MDTDTLSILVPTFNRYPRLLRLLKHYRACESSVNIHILDSSEHTLDHPELKELIRSSGVIYSEFDEHINLSSKLLKALQQVTTPYVVLWADDDLMVPKSLEAGASFLDENPDFSIAHGGSGLFKVQSGTVDWVTSYPQHSYTDETASERLVRYLSNYSVTYYSVQRTQNLLANLKKCHQHGFAIMEVGKRNDWWAELLPGSLSVIQGKAMKLDRLYMLRETHSGMTSGAVDKEVDLFDWVSGTWFSQGYEQFSACLADELARQDGIDHNEARDVVKQAFWSYLSRGLMKKWGGRYAQESSRPRSGLRRWARGVPAIKWLWRQGSSLRSGESYKMSLPALLRPTSPYHADFMQIYRAITESRAATSR